MQQRIGRWLDQRTIAQCRELMSKLRVEFEWYESLNPEKQFDVAMKILSHKRNFYWITWMVLRTVGTIATVLIGARAVLHHWR